LCRDRRNTENANNKAFNLVWIMHTSYGFTSIQLSTHCPSGPPKGLPSLCWFLIISSHYSLILLYSLTPTPLPLRTCSTNEAFCWMVCMYDTMGMQYAHTPITQKPRVVTRPGY
jgi:hypothetical protein